jgi:hypothetical protein
VDANEASRQQTLMVIEAAQRAGRSEAEITAIVELDLTTDEHGIAVQERADRKAA